ncbi:helix-turn-helix domain-containing protein [Yinghuangia seranimata]|uniref:helix-turn-helix domain-containing protein n=1 Tax=Yinghuangia seranimata TaxID=408067 RepID=UPI00248CC6BD|nr:helix-turn-helix transcriptional regulator [Yinghuangia seranimata]MDI2128555.1 helix-turn-helix transcriptional regulator [Yinghuangia seranimata]
MERELRPDRSARDLYGSELRRHRTGAGLTLARLAQILRYSKTHLGNIETADRMIPPDLSPKLDAAFGTDGYFVRLYGLARHEQHPGKYRRFMELEAQASRILQYSGHLFPGLLQTEAYARSSLHIGDPEADDDEIEQLVAIRLGRQERLRSECPPHLSVILDEAVLRRPLGGVSTIRRQLAALLPVMDTGRTMIQVLPFSHGGHGLLGGSMTALTLPDDTTVVYLEGIQSGQIVEESEEVTRRIRAYERLRSYAYSPTESAAFITSVMEDYRRCDPQRPRRHRARGARARTAAPTAANALKSQRSSIN